MSISWRHHYIPQFFIKQFADDEGFVYAYNKQTDKISASRQSPKSIFFGENRNTVNIHGYNTDNLEHVFAEMDSRFSASLKNVLRTRIISPEELTDIVVFANSLKWRTPFHDVLFDQLKVDTSIVDLGIEIKVNEPSSSVQDAIEILNKSDLIKETKRILLALLPFLKGEMLLTIHNNSFINNNPHFPSLLGDCAFIEKQHLDINSIEDFIFPLSSWDTFIFKMGTRKQISNPLFFIQRNLATIHLSKNYVVCRDHKRLTEMVEMYRQIRSSNMQDKIVEYLFLMIA